MKFKFKIQQYQTDAVENTVNVFRGQTQKTAATLYRRDLGRPVSKDFFENDDSIVTGKQIGRAHV